MAEPLTRVASPRVIPSQETMDGRCNEKGAAIKLPRHAYL